jgi:hypothetical protein
MTDHRKVSGWACTERLQLIERMWLRGVDLNHRPLGYEANPKNDSIIFQRLDGAGNDSK